MATRKRKKKKTSNYPDRVTQLKKDNKCFCFSLFSYSEEELVVGSTWLLWYTATWNYQLCLFPPCLCFHMILSLKSNIAKTKPKPASEPTKPAWFFFLEAFCGVNGWWSCSLFLHSLSEIFGLLTVMGLLGFVR